MKPLLVASMLMLTSASAAQAEADHAAIARASLTEVIRPGYAAFRDAADGLKTNIAALCETPSAAALKDAREAFAATVAAWSEVEIFRFGPVGEKHRHERVFYWPDPKGLGLKQVRDVLANKDEAATLPDELAKKSVALQGLPAFEYLLYGDGADGLATRDGATPKGAPLPEIPTDAAFRCAFALAAATNIDRIAKSIVEGWREGSAYEKSFLGPAPEDPRYHTPKEVALDLFKSLTSGIELVRDQKLGKPLGASPDQARPKLAAFWRSGLSLDNAAGNLEGVRALFAQGGFAQVVAGESAGVENSILFDLDNAIKVLRGIGAPIEEAVKDEPSRAKLEALRVSLKSARDTASDMISRGADLSFGFNAGDGD